MLPQAMAQLIVSQSQRFGGRALVETMLIERRLQNRHFMRIDSGAEITDVIKETRLFLSRNNELGFVRCAGGLVHGGSKRPPRRLKRIETNIGTRNFRSVPTIDSALHHVATLQNITWPLISFQPSNCFLP